MSNFELALSREGEVLRKFVNRHSFSGNILYTYNYWIETILPQQIKSRVPISKSGTYSIKDVIVTPRPINEDGSPRTPKFCRERGIPYTARVSIIVNYKP